MAEEFVNQCMVHCPAVEEPTARRDVLRALCAFAAKPPYFSHSTRDALQRALELLVENPGEVSINFPKKHTVYPYLASTAEAKGPKTARMLRRRPGWDCGGANATGSASSAAWRPDGVRRHGPLFFKQRYREPRVHIRGYR